MKTPETALLTKLLDFSVHRQQTIAANIANANTPGYTRQRVLFEEALANQLEQSPNAALDHLAPEVIDDHRQPARADGNNVDLSSEMGELMQNTLYHQLLTRALSAKMRIYHQSVS